MPTTQHENVSPEKLRKKQRQIFRLMKAMRIPDVFDGRSKTRKGGDWRFGRYHVLESGNEGIPTA